MLLENRSSRLLPIRPNGRLPIAPLEEMSQEGRQGGVLGESELGVVLTGVRDEVIRAWVRVGGGRCSKRTQIANVPSLRNTLAASGHIRDQSNQWPD